MAPALDPATRSELAARLLERTLLALSNAPSVARTILVSPDPLARALARGYGAEALDDDGVPLNAAIERGLRAAEAAGARTAVVIPVDLAAIDAAAIEALIAEWRSRNTATQPGILAASDGGTAALVLPLPTALVPHFGPESATAHEAECVRIGTPAGRLHSPLADDIDTIQDLASAVRQHPPVSHAGIMATAIDGLGEINAGDDLPLLIATCIARATERRQIGPLRPDDVIAVTQKIVSKAEGRLVEIDPDDPLSHKVLVEQEARRVVRRRGDLIITETKHGFICANSGVDLSNVERGYAAIIGAGAPGADRGGTVGPARFPARGKDRAGFLSLRTSLFSLP